MTSITLRLASLAVCLGGAVAAQDLSLPGNATLTREVIRDPGSYALPTARWSEDTGLPVRVFEGAVTLRTFRLEGSGLTPLQLMAPLRDQLTEAGWQIVLDCANRGCGGFDFRFGTEVLPAPAMYVDLAAYRFLSATGPLGQAVSILTSRDRGAGYVQIARVGQTAPAVQTDAPAQGTPVPATVPIGDLAETLEATGHAVLSDLEFETGSASLGDGPVASLDALAAYLTANPTRRIVFVGHTDAVGSLDANRALSRRRAQAAVAYLTARDIPTRQISADGVGYLSPIASNLTAEGREANRRVEAVLISTD